MCNCIPTCCQHILAIPSATTIHKAPVTCISLCSVCMENSGGAAKKQPNLHKMQFKPHPTATRMAHRMFANKNVHRIQKELMSFKTNDRGMYVRSKRIKQKLNFSESKNNC